jgi:hypothetical protein
MNSIHVKRYENDPELQGCIEPEDRRWQLLIDKEGVPHLVVQTNVEMDDGQVTHGYFAIDDILPPDVTVSDIMKSTFGGRLSPEEEAKLIDEDFRSKAPCPR